MLVQPGSEISDASADEIYRKCLRCGRIYLYCYWDYELDAYIYLTKEDDLACNRCSNPFAYAIH